MSQPREDQPTEVGISHYPLEEEQARQQKVVENASSEGETPAETASHHGHRLSRQADPPSAEEAEERFEGKGGKGGKTGGSRAGLLSANRKEQPGRT